MAKVYKRTQGGVSMKVTKAVALHRVTQWKLDEVAAERGGEADVILSSHRYQGHSEVSVESGKVDRFVVLDDDRGLAAAMSIEFGRKLPGGRTTPVGALKGAFPEANIREL